MNMGVGGSLAAVCQSGGIELGGRYLFAQAAAFHADQKVCRCRHGAVYYRRGKRHCAAGSLEQPQGALQRFKLRLGMGGEAVIYQHHRGLLHIGAN